MKQVQEKLKEGLEFYKKRSKRERVVILAAVGFVLFASIDFLMVKPFVGEAKQIREEVDLKKKQLEKMQKIMTRSNRIRGEHKLYAKKFKTTLPDGQILTDLLTQIENTARATNVKIVNMNPKPMRNEKSYKEISVSVIAMGDMRQLMSFFYQLESSDEVIRISRLQLSPSDQAGNENNLKTEMVVVRNYINESRSSTARLRERKQS